MRSTAISLELNLDGEALSGHASDGHGGRREFTGWIGLIAAIEALLRPDDRGDDR